eukprot:jgi/Psemu1/283630/fgenesh1_pg.30_\
MRYDLAFFLCCCKSFLGSGNDYNDGNENENENDNNGNNGNNANFYRLLGIEPDATQDEIKRAYKRQSLRMHPDKLAQRGKVATEDDQNRFTRMKDAYECLSDPHKRETYDAIGEKGMKWLDEPFSVDPQELAHNFTKSSVLDRSKIFAIFVGLAVALLSLPVLVCLHLDGAFGSSPSGGGEWIDPFPMKHRIVSLVRFLLLVCFELLLALKLDSLIDYRWAVVFVPLVVWEATTVAKKWRLSRLRVVTIDDLETAIGKPFGEFTADEKERIGRKYSVVPSIDGPEFRAAQALKTDAGLDLAKSGFRILFLAVLAIRLDKDLDWNWWLVFAPFWATIFVVCQSNYKAFSEVQNMAAEKDPDLFFAAVSGQDEDEETGPNASVNANTETTNNDNYTNTETANTNTVIGTETGTTTNYGSVGVDDSATTEATRATTYDTAGQQPRVSNLTDEEKEQLREQVMNSGSRFCTRCCSQGFFAILLCLVVAKLQGATFSTVWIISPLLFAAGIILCCLGCAIFGVSEVNEGDYANGPEFFPATVIEVTDDGLEPGSPLPMTDKDDELGPNDTVESAGLMATTTGGSIGSPNTNDMRILDLD